MRPAAKRLPIIHSVYIRASKLTRLRENTKALPQRLKRPRKKSRRKQIHIQRRGHLKFQTSDLKFQKEETANSNTNANANPNANANADPSPLKGVRDDSFGAFFRG